MFCTVSLFLNGFGTVSLPYDTRFKSCRTIAIKAKVLKPQSCVDIVHNAQTQSTPLDPKLMFWCVSQCLGAFVIVSLLHETWCKMGWTSAINAKVHATKSFPNFSQQMQLIHPHWNIKSCFVLFRSVWVHLGPFRWFTILGSNHAELLQLKQKFKPQSCNRILCNKSAQSTASDPKLMLWCVS